MSISREKILTAISKRRKILIKYIDAQGSVTNRKINPYHGFKRKHKLYFMGFCHHDNDLRTFSISRIKGFKILDESFNDDIKTLNQYKAQGYFYVFGTRYPITNLLPITQKDNKQYDPERKVPIAKPKQIYQTSQDYVRTRFYTNDFDSDNEFPKSYSSRKLSNAPGICRSPMEEIVFTRLDFDSTVKKYKIEPVRIPYITGDTQRIYTPDILVTYKSGNRVLIEVKSILDVNNSENLIKYNAAQYIVMKSKSLFRCGQLKKG